MASQQKVIVLQHIACEHPGIFRDFMKDRGITWDAVELDEGEKIPDISGYDAMISMGGPMDVWQEDLFPWLVDEKEAIHDAVRVRNMPFSRSMSGPSAVGGSRRWCSRSGSDFRSRNAECGHDRKKGNSTP